MLTVRCTARPSFRSRRNRCSPSHWANAARPVTRDRLYDFYTKQADYFRQQHHVPMLLAQFPGLDGGKQGHWGNQNEAVWADGRWNEAQLGSVQSGVFQADGMTVARGVCLRLGDHGELSACFNPDTLTYDAVWSGGFVGFDSVRHGFVSALRMDGQLVPLPEQNSARQTFQVSRILSSRQSSRLCVSNRGCRVS